MTNNSFISVKGTEKS